MSIESIVPALVCILIAYITAFFISKFHKFSNLHSRNNSIDGLRGYLSLLVYLCHAVVWYYFIVYDRWREPPSIIYLHFGVTSVIFFFMITSFLFWSKLLRSKQDQIVWSKIYITRVLRLSPLYILMVIIVLIYVCILSDFSMNEPFLMIIKEIVKWLSFGILGSPNINAVKNTSLMIAQVNWSLPYEWMFYFTLPASALLLGLKPKVLPTLLYTIISILIFHKANLNIFYVYAFIGGILSAYIVRKESLVRLASKRSSSLLCIVFIICGILTYNFSLYIYLLFISLAFMFIALGNNLFGILVSKASLILGQMGYSIYLLHGLILYSTFNFVFDTKDLLMISPLNYWLIILSLTPILVLVSHFTYTFIETPFMKYAAKVINIKSIRLKDNNLQE